VPTRDLLVDEVFERSLANRIALVKLLLAVGNVAVVVWDESVATTGAPADYTRILIAVSAFATLQLVMFGIGRRGLRPKTYLVVSPLVDIVATIALTLMTGGYASPFILWFALAIVSAGFAPNRATLVIATAAGVLAHVFVASIPQNQPLDRPAIAVRTAYLIGFSGLVGLIGIRTREQAEIAQLMDAVGRQMGRADTEPELKAIAMAALDSILGGRRFELALPVDETADPKEATYKIPFEFQPYGTGMLYVHGLFLSARRLEAAKTLCERLVSAILRLRLTTEMVEVSVQEERMRLADELHDYYLQTLAAIDLFAESAMSRIPDDNAAREDLRELKSVARGGAHQARQFIREHDMQPPSGPDEIVRLINERWGPQATVEIDREVGLKESQWRAIGMLVREGLNNARRHAKASAIKMQVYRTDSGVTAVLINDGEAPKTAIPGYGLRRLASIIGENGGTLTLRGVDGTTRLEAVFPVTVKT